MGFIQALFNVDQAYGDSAPASGGKQAYFGRKAKSSERRPRTDKATMDHFAKLLNPGGTAASSGTATSSGARRQSKIIIVWFPLSLSLYTDMSQWGYKATQKIQKRLITIKRFFPLLK